MLNYLGTQEVIMPSPEIPEKSPTSPAAQPTSPPIIRPLPPTAPKPVHTRTSTTGKQQLGVGGGDRSNASPVPFERGRIPPSEHNAAEKIWDGIIASIKDAWKSRHHVANVFRDFIDRMIYSPQKRMQHLNAEQREPRSGQFSKFLEKNGNLEAFLDRAQKQYNYSGDRDSYKDKANQLLSCEFQELPAVSDNDNESREEYSDLYIDFIANSNLFSGEAYSIIRGEVVESENLRPEPIRENTPKAQFLSVNTADDKPGALILYVETLDAGQKKILSDMLKVYDEALKKADNQKEAIKQCATRLAKSCFPVQYIKEAEKAFAELLNQRNHSGLLGALLSEKESSEEGVSEL